MIGVDYDAADPAPTSKAQLQSYEDAVKVNSWMECTHVSKKRNLQKYPNYFTDFLISQDSSSLAAERQNNVGTLSVATIGQGNDGKVIGELYVEYTIRLETPQLGQPSGALSLETAGPTPWPPFELAGATEFKYSGDVVLKWPASSNYRAYMQQNFEGLLSIYQIGTGITGHPTLQIISGPGTSQLLITCSSSVGATSMYNVSFEPGTEFGIAAGANTTLTKWHLGWISAKKQFLQHLG